jgi:hypothetical protein
MASFFKRSIGKIKFSNPFKSSASKGRAGESVEIDVPKKEKALTRFKNYLITIVTDYKDVAVDSVKSAKEKPFKTLTYGLGITSIVVFYKKNPDYTDYVHTRKELMNDILMCGSTYSRRSYFYLNELNRLENLNQLEYKPCVFFSLIMVKKFSEFDATYEKRCTQLNTPNKFNIFNVTNVVLKFVSRIVDIGFCDEWYFLNKSMKDYDVNEVEWINENSKSDESTDSNDGKKALM